MTSAYAPSPARAPCRADGRRTYVLDTSVLLADPRALRALRRARGRAADRRADRAGGQAQPPRARLGGPPGAAPARATSGSSTARSPSRSRSTTTAARCGSSSTTSDTAGLPAALTADNNDHRILAVARNLAAEGRDVTVVTKDLPLRLKAQHRRPRRRRVPQRAGRRHAAGPASSSSTSTPRPSTSCSPTASSTSPRPATCRATPAWRCIAGSQSALGPGPRRQAGPPRARRPQRCSTCTGRSAEQRIAIDLLADPSVGIVSLGGAAGTGKSVLALAAGLDAVLEQRTHKRVVVFRPLFAVGGQDLGFLPGDRDREDGPVGRRRAPTPSRPSSGRRSSTRSSTATCSRCCRSPTSAAAASPTRS